jgi:hypothetical protein
MSTSVSQARSCLGREPGLGRSVTVGEVVLGLAAYPPAPARVRRPGRRLLGSAGVLAGFAPAGVATYARHGGRGFRLSHICPVLG